MMYLLDTNILLELLLDQEGSDEVERFISISGQEDLFLTDFALHSIGVILIRNELYDLLSSLIDDIHSSGRIQIVSLELNDFPHIVSAVRQYRLDFDDAYQYVAAENNNLTIVSFDSDFDRTKRGRKTPAEVLEI